MTREQPTDLEWEYVEPYLPIGEYGPYPARLRKQFEGVVWKFRINSKTNHAGTSRISRVQDLESGSGSGSPPTGRQPCEK
ncbi:hypothetical protein EES39_23100 [Streptomyces sp. ADI92-24]|nr:hypothetical protein EES39_23100 [Streptomyces sp. ADI92-24]